MTARTLETGEDLEALRTAWSDLHRRAGGTVFGTPEWLLSWWQVFRPGFTLRVLASWDGDRLVGLLPCFIGSAGSRPARIRRMRLLGEHSIMGEYAPLVDPECRETVLEGAASWCAATLRERRCQLVDFHQFGGADPAIESLAGFLRRQGMAVRFTPQSLPRVRLHAPPTADDYWSSLTYNERAFLGRRERLMHRAGAELETITSAADRHAVDDFISLHTAAWESRSQPGFFRGREGFEAFHRRCLPLLLERGYARVYFYNLGGKRFAALLGLFLHSRCSLYLSGRDPQHELARHSPGRVLMSLVIREAIREGFRDIDLMQGTTDYKFRTGGQLDWYGRLSVCLPGLRSLPARLASYALFTRDTMRARTALRSFQVQHAPAPPARGTKD